MELAEQVITKCKLFRTVFISLLTYLIGILFLFIFAIYRIIIDIILKTRFSRRYGGLVDKKDTFFFLPGISKCCITTVLFMKSDKEVNVLHSFRKRFEEMVFANPDLYPKLTSSQHNFGGYPYWIKNDCIVSDVIKPLRIEENISFTEEVLKEKTAEITNSDHSKNETVLWDIHVSETPLKDDKNDNCYRYPVVCRFHHAIGDGTSLVALLIRILGDEKSQNYGNDIFKNVPKEALTYKNNQSPLELFELNLIKLIKAVALCLECFFLSPGRMAERTQLWPRNLNTLHSPSCSGKTIAAWATEKDVECIPLVKKIKNRTNTKFSWVVGTAISASMTNYFKRNLTMPIPDYTTGGITVLLDFSIQDISKPVMLENRATLCVFKLPCTHKSKNLIEALEKVAKTMAEQIKYTDALMNRFVLLQAGYLPPKVMHLPIAFDAHTFVITNVPGGSLIKTHDGCILETIVPFAPIFLGIGISFAVLSYDNRLQIGVSVERSLKISQKEVQRIADDVLDSIRIMGVETQQIYGDF